jgi:hypothetical protein
VPPPPEVRTFSITRPPMATDAHRHPVFLQLAGALAIDAVAPGDRVFVIREVFTALLPDDPSMRARVVAAFDRTDSRTGSRTGP